MAEPSLLMRLPLELRESIYAQYFAPDKVEDEYFGGGCYKYRFELLRACKRIHHEAQTVWRRQNVFVRVETPDPEAIVHICTRGQVPVVTVGPAAALFPHHHALVSISMPTFGRPAMSENSLVLLAQDLSLLCEHWYYALLGFPELKVATVFTLRDPYYPADPKPVPLALQRRILLPFGALRGSYRMEFEGGWDEDLKKDVETRMAENLPSLEECLDEAGALMEEGDNTLAISPKENAEAVLKLYQRAFHAIHILVDGRSRKVVADNFFNRHVFGGRYAHSVGTTVRFVQRLQLVSRTVLAYLHASQPLEAAFWGMRTIRLMDEYELETTFDHWRHQEAFGVAADLGLVYSRTAIAASLLERAGMADWAEQVDCADDEYTAPNIEGLWRFAASQLNVKARQGQRQKALDEARAFGVRVESSFSEPGREVEVSPASSQGPGPMGPYGW